MKRDFFCLLVPGDVSISRETRTECGEVEEAMNERSKKANKKKKRKMERERERKISPHNVAINNK